MVIKYVYRGVSNIELNNLPALFSNTNLVPCQCEYKNYPRDLAWQIEGLCNTRYFDRVDLCCEFYFLLGVENSCLV